MTKQRRKRPLIAVRENGEWWLELPGALGRAIIEGVPIKIMRNKRSKKAKGLYQKAWLMTLDPEADWSKFNQMLDAISEDGQYELGRSK